MKSDNTLYNNDYKVNEKDCKYCKERGKTWSGDNPECGFKEVTFDMKSNWACATTMYLRRIIEEIVYSEDYKKNAWSYRDDMAAASIGALYVPENTIKEVYGGFYIVMSWYKDRGSTGQAYIFRDDIATPLIFEYAENAIEYWKKELKIKL